MISKSMWPLWKRQKLQKLCSSLTDLRSFSLWRLKCLDCHLKNQSTSSKSMHALLTPCKSALVQLTPCKPMLAQLTPCHLWPWQRSIGGRQNPNTDLYSNLCLFGMALILRMSYSNKYSIIILVKVIIGYLSVYKYIESFKMLTKLPIVVLIREVLQWVHFS